MLWIGLILASAVTLGIYDVCKKHAVDANAVMPVLFLATATGTVVAVLWQTVTGDLLPSLRVDAITWWLLVLKSAIVTASWICAYYAMRALPISIAAPIRGSQPAWTLIGALLIFAERPLPWQWVGIAITFGGYYAFSLLGKREGIRFERHAGIALIVLATIIGAVSGLYDKYLLQPRRLTPQTVQCQTKVEMSAVSAK